MGIARTNGKPSSHRQRLAAIADELRPSKPPFWVTQPDRKTPAQGWWWIPEGIDAPEFLGYNHITAETALNQLVDAHYKP
jgi:hypothetical protein